MQFRGLDARLTVLTERTAQTARFDRTENVRLEDARSGRSIREGQRRDLAHVFHTVAEPMIRNVAPAIVTEVFTPAWGAGWQFPAGSELGPYRSTTGGVRRDDGLVYGGSTGAEVID